MDDATIQDLKQFITSIVTQQVSEVRGDIKQLNTKIDDLSLSVAEALDNSNEATDTQLKNHEQRIKKLEQKVA